MKGRTTIERCAASAGAVSMAGAFRLPAKKYQIPPATRTSATIPAMSAASIDRCFGSDAFASLAGFTKFRRADLQRIDPDRFGDVLELRWAKVGYSEIDPSLDLPIGLLRETDRGRLADALQSGRDVHPVAHEIAVALLDDVAEMDTDAKFNSPFGGQAGVTFDHAGLHFDSAAHRVDHAAELDEAAIAGALDDAPMMRVDGWIDQIAAEPPAARKGPILVGAGEPAITNDIRNQDRRELSGFGHGAPSRVMQRIAQERLEPPIYLSEAIRQKKARPSQR